MTVRTCLHRRSRWRRRGRCADRPLQRTARTGRADGPLAGARGADGTLLRCAGKRRADRALRRSARLAHAGRRRVAGGRRGHRIGCGDRRGLPGHPRTAISAEVHSWRVLGGAARASAPGQPPGRLRSRKARLGAWLRSQPGPTTETENRPLRTFASTVRAPGHQLSIETIGKIVNKTRLKPGGGTGDKMLRYGIAKARCMR